MVVMLIRKQLVICPVVALHILPCHESSSLRTQFIFNSQLESTWLSVCKGVKLFPPFLNPEFAQCLAPRFSRPSACLVLRDRRRLLLGIPSFAESAILARWNLAIISWSCSEPPMRRPGGSLWSGRCSLITRISSALLLNKQDVTLHNEAQTPHCGSNHM